MVFITIVTGAYKPTYILGASHCRYESYESRLHKGKNVIQVTLVVLDEAAQLSPFLVDFIGHQMGSSPGKLYVCIYI